MTGKGFNQYMLRNPSRREIGSPAHIQQPTAHHLFRIWNSTPHGPQQFSAEAASQLAAAAMLA
jgi:hypothetical protein